MKSLSLRQNFSWTLLGNVIYAGCQWGMLVVLAKIGSPEKVGQFALGLAITAPIIIFSEMALRPIQATDAKKDYQFSHYFGLRLLTTSIALLLIFMVALVGDYQRETKLVIMAIGLAKSVEAVSDIIFGLLQQHERMDRIAISMMLKGPLSLTALAVALYLTGSVFWGSLALAIVWFLLLASYDLVNASLLLKASNPVTPAVNLGFLTVPRPSWDQEKLIRLAWLAFPLSFVMLINSLKVNIPRYFIEGYLGERELGFYAAMAYVMQAGNMINNALGQSASPRLAKYYALQKKGNYVSLLLKLTGIGTLIGGLGVMIVFFFGKEILTLLYSPEFALQSQVFIWIMIANAISFAGGFLGYGLTAARYLQVQLPIKIVVIVLTLLTCYLLIPKYGLMGAAWGSAIVFLSEIFMNVLVIKNAIRSIAI